MDTIAEFRLLVLDSLKYSSKAESPINRSTKAVISRSLTTSRHNHLFIYLFYLFIYLFIHLFIHLFICLFIYLFIYLGSFFFFFFFFFHFIFHIHIFTENRHCRHICIAIATVVVG